MHIPLLTLTLSTVITFAILLVLVRVIGSTQLSQLTYFNWVAGASLGNIAANMLVTTDRTIWLSNCYSLILFSLASVVAAFISLKSRSFRRVSNGEPVVLIHKGAILRDNLRRTKVNTDVLMMLLREQGFYSYGELEFAILEPSGNLSILPKQESQSSTKRDLAEGPDMSPSGQGPYLELVIDGEIDEDKMRAAGKSHEWLEQEIKRLGAQRIEDVMYLGINEQGDVIADTHRRDSESLKNL